MSNYGSRLRHGLYKHPLYRCWVETKRRCHEPKDKGYKWYGARGIVMYKPWRAKPALFISWIERTLGPRPKDKSLDRINNDGNYVPGNLRWATNRQQIANRRRKSPRPFGVRRTKSRRFKAMLYLGTYDTPEEAERAYVESRKRLKVK